MQLTYEASGLPILTLQPGQGFTVGRSRHNDVVIPVKTVSRDHAIIYWSRGRAWVQDAGSRNGTFVNGLRVKRREALSPGDEISLGCSVALTVRFGGAGGDRLQPPLAAPSCL